MDASITILSFIIFRIFYKINSVGWVLSWKIITRLLFITAHVGSETEEAIWHNLNSKLKETTGFDLEYFEKHFSFITDDASRIPKEFGE